MSLLSLYNSFKPIFYLSVIFGSMPLSFSNKPFVHLKISRYRVYYVGFCLLCMVIHGIATPWFFTKTNSSPLLLEPEGATNVSNYVSFIRNQTSAQIVTMKVVNHLINTIMGIGSLWVSVFYLTTQLPIFLSHLADIDRGLVPFMHFPPRYNYYISLILTGYFTVMSLPIYTFYLYIVYTQREFVFQVWSTFLLFCIASSYTVEIQFINWALCLLLRFRIINNFLKRYSTQNDLFNTFIRLSTNKEWSVKQRLTIRRIELIHQCDKKLCDLMEDLNNMYQLQLLLSVAGCFIKILFNIYFALFTAFTNDNKKTDQIQTTNTILWTTFYCIRFLVTIVTACKTSDQAYKTKSLVSSVNRRSFEPDIKEELNIFLQHTSNQTFKFTACGLFTLSTQLITSAVAAGTTYLVILIQFRPQIN